MPGFMERLNKVINDSDILIEIIDARFPQETRNKEIEQKIKNKKKELIIIINKSDLVSKNYAMKTKKKIVKEFPTIFVSSKKKQGIKALRTLLIRKAGKKTTKIGVIGYPNTGKSSIINSLTRRSSAQTSIKAGFTRGEQLINLGNNVKLIDMPGIIETKQWNETELALIGAKSHNQVKDIQTVAEKIIEKIKQQNPTALKKFGIKNSNKEAEEILEEIAINKKRIMKKGKPDINAVSKMLLIEWQKGTLK